MNINVIASSSKGNATIITHGNNKLLLDAGISIKKIEKALNYDLTSLDGCLISHEHMDHARAVNDLMKLSVDCYMSNGTRETFNILNHSRLNIIYRNESFFINSWIVLPFNLIHDAKEPLGFLIFTSDNLLLYAIDTGYIPYSFKNLTHIMIECNYSLDIVRQKTKAEELPVMMKNRLLKYHMSLETCKKFLQANDLSHVKEIWLLHISERHGDKQLFKEEIQKLTGKIVKTI